MPYRKSEAAHHDQEHGREVDQRISHILLETGVSDNIDPRIAEGGYRMEHRISDPGNDSVLRYKLKGKKHGADPFHKKGPLQDPYHKFYHSGKRIQPICLLDRDPALHGDPLSQHQIEC